MFGATFVRIIVTKNFEKSPKSGHTASVGLELGSSKYGESDYGPTITFMLIQQSPRVFERLTEN